jgi:1-acyl-sn-glycerol-3-phosphate acyltransferase
MLFDTALLDDLKKRTKEVGHRKALIEVFKKFEITEIKTFGTIPDKGPLLIISNHPGVFDTLILLSQVQRDDFYFAALSQYRVFGESIAKFLLPIHRKKGLNHRIYEYPLSLQGKNSERKELSQKEIRERNRLTIALAADLINQGKAVSIFPTGTAGKKLNGSRWKAGVGFLIKQIKNPMTKVVFANIKGTKPSDITAYMHPMIRSLFFKPKEVSISFSRAFSVKDLIDINLDGKVISKKLEIHYDQLF